MNTHEQDLFQVHGAAALSGLRYFHIIGTFINLWVRASAVALPHGLEEALASLQIVTTPRQRARLVEQMSAVRDFPPMPLAEKGGWLGTTHYFDRGGTCIGGVDAPIAAEIAFSSELRGTTSRGNVNGWRRRVARPLTGQTLLQFLIMVSFSGPLLGLTNRQLNLLFEVVGPGGEGKSSALQIAASPSGPAIDRGEGTYWFTPSGTVNWLEQLMLAHADATALINEFQVFGAGETAAARAKMVYDFVFRFSEGQTRGWFKGKQSLTYRGAGLLTGNQPIHEVISGRYASLINPTTSRLISLPGDAGHGLGTLDFVPHGFADARSFIMSVLEQTTRQHGTAFPDFVRQLTALRVADETALRRRIAWYVEAFLARTNGSAGGMQARIAEGFAIPYVAGRLAQYFGVLPPDWDPEAIALESYRRYMISIQAAEGRPVVGLLRAYAARPEIIDLDQGLPDLSDEQMLNVIGFRQTVQGRLELCVPQGAVTRLFADWEYRKDSAELRPFLLRDSDHFARKRVVRQNTGRRSNKDRMLVFTNF